MQGLIPRRNGTSYPRTLTAVLFAMLAGLVTLVTLAPGGPMGFLQGIVEKKDAISIAILASLMGVSFVLLHRNGVTLDENEVEAPMQ